MSRTTNKRRGLRRLECPCGAAIYATWAQVERHGVPSCACGERFTPDDVELAMALGLEDAPAVIEYRAALSSIMHGQAWHGLARGAHYADPTVEAAARVERSRRARARSNRLQAIMPVAEPMPF